MQMTRLALPKAISPSDVKPLLLIKRPRVRDSKQFSPVPGQTYVGVGRLQESMNELFAALVGAARKM